MSGRWGLLAAAGLLLAGCAASTSPVAPLPAPTVDGATGDAGGTVGAMASMADTSQQAVAWLFGTSEAALLYRQTFESVLRYVDEQPAGAPVVASAIAVAGGENPLEMQLCADRASPRAVIFDLDETLVWNIGHQYWQAKHNQPFDPAKWAQWEQDGGPGLLATPGAVELVQALRARGIVPVFSSNRQSTYAAQTARDLEKLGFGKAVHLDTLWLEGDTAGGSRKDARRQQIARRYCVIAQVGDQLGDFTDLIDFDAAGARRTRAARAALVEDQVRSLEARGWFLLPNPMYGRWNQPLLSIDEAVPPANRWTPRSK